MKNVVVMCGDDANADADADARVKFEFAIIQKLPRRESRKSR
jgi:hypothetical protein